MKLLKPKMIRLLFIIFSLSAFAAKKTLPSVEDMDHVNKNKFDIAVFKCISNNEELKKLYVYDTVKIIMQNKYNKAIPQCPEIFKSLERINSVQKEMHSIANMPECSENAHQQQITLDDARIVQEQISNRYNAIAQEYTQFFTYDANLANVEACMNFYDEFTVAQNINIAEQNKIDQLIQAEKIASKHRLEGIYGNDNIVKSLEQAITDLQSNVITKKELSRYAILEYDTKNWKLVGAFDNKLVYSNGNVNIAIKIVKGVSYSTESLPYSIFQMQKKIDIKKNQYSIFLVKPLI